MRRGSGIECPRKWTVVSQLEGKGVVTEEEAVGGREWAVKR